MDVHCSISISQHKAVIDIVNCPDSETHLIFSLHVSMCNVDSKQIRRQLHNNLTLGGTRFAADPYLASCRQRSSVSQQLKVPDSIAYWWLCVVGLVWRAVMHLRFGILRHITLHSPLPYSPSCSISHCRNIRLSLGAEAPILVQKYVDIYVFSCRKYAVNLFMRFSRECFKQQARIWQHHSSCSTLLCIANWLSLLCSFAQLILLVL